MMRELDPQVWFGQRDVNPVPRHFIKTSPIASYGEMLEWVLTRLRGRYGYRSTTEFDFSPTVEHFFFEDPAEAMMFELRWSGDDKNIS
jgi:hypothetical protein